VKLALPQPGAQKPSSNKDHKREPAITIRELAPCDQMKKAVQSIGEVNYEVI